MGRSGWLRIYEYNIRKLLSCMDTCSELAYIEKPGKLPQRPYLPTCLGCPSQDNAYRWACVEGIAHFEKINKNTGHPVKFESQIKNKHIFCMSPNYFMERSFLLLFNILFSINLEKNGKSNIKFSLMPRWINFYIFI